MATKKTNKTDLKLVAPIATEVEQAPIKPAKIKKAAVKSETVKSKSDTIDAKVPATQILDAEKVLAIIALGDSGKKPAEIAPQFNIAPSHVSNILRGVSWSHVTNRYYMGKGKHWSATPPVKKGE
jgi:hypothetical protein